MKSTLHLPLKAKWYDMIESGEKKEEYRENKPYWAKRIIGRKYKYVRFSYGYTKRTMTYEVDGITFGQGKKEWGAPDEAVHIIKLGRRVEPAENHKCCVCGKKATAWWPVLDPDIPAHPYCRDCVSNEIVKTLAMFSKNDKKGGEK